MRLRQLFKRLLGGIDDVILPVGNALRQALDISGGGGHVTFPMDVRETTHHGQDDRKSQA
jgi:hypothetical protein